MNRQQQIAERRALLKKRFFWGRIQLAAVLLVTFYNCVAEIVLPTFVLPISFYLPQFLVYYAQNMLDGDGHSVSVYLLCALAFALVALFTFCLIWSKKHYKLVKILTFCAGVDLILLIYFGIMTLFSSGFQLFFVANAFLHIWILYLTVSIPRAAEGLEVLPENTEDFE